MLPEKPSSPEREPRTLFQGCGVCSYSFLAEITMPFYLSSSVIISFQITENILIGTRTQDSFFGFLTFVPFVFSPKQIMLVLPMFFYRH
jgi:hypothetical protein